MALLDWLRRRRAAARLHRAGHAALDALFADPARLAAVRLRPHHRGRVTLLEVDPAPDGALPARLLFGIIRHPKAHPLAPRGEEVLELIEYEPPDGTPRYAGGKRLSGPRAS